MFYVYIYRDPRPTKNRQVVYVGKGTGDRDLSHWSRGSHNKPLQDFLSHLKRRELVPIVERVFETKIEELAFAKEMELIALYGRKDLKKGALFNLTDGGEGIAGYKKSEKEKETDRNSLLQNWQKPEYLAKVVAGQKKAQNTPKALATKSKNSKALCQEQPEKMAASIKAGRNTEESRAKTSAQLKAQWEDPIYAEQQTLRNKEIANREEVKAAKKAAAKALWADPVWKAKMLEARKK